MPGQDPNNNLDQWPLNNLDLFISECIKNNVTEINLTGTNTDPMLYNYLPELISYLRNAMPIPNLRIGLRTNGVIIDNRLNLFDKVSISVTSFDSFLYNLSMGNGSPPNIKKIVNIMEGKRLKLNVVLCPETKYDLINTLIYARDNGIKCINLREPYGQPNIGNPFTNEIFLQEFYKKFKVEILPDVYGMPCFKYDDVSIVYWDVHYVHVTSVNLYADGHISSTYPVSLGHSETFGKVLPQNKFIKGRQFAQWNNYRPPIKRVVRSFMIR